MLIAGTGVEQVVHVPLDRGYRVVGLEGFELEDIKILPLLDHIFGCADTRWPDAQAAVSEWSENVWVDISLERAAP